MNIDKIIRDVSLFFMLLIPIALFTQYLLYPQETRCILINFSSLKKDGRVYYDTTASPQTIDSLKTIIDSASTRVTNFWGEKKSDPKFIYCTTADEYKKYGDDNASPATTHYKLGNYIVISHDGLSINIIAHEMSHAELKQRIGFYNETCKIPTWFDEGMAMQNDYRSCYSEDSFRVASNNYKKMADCNKLLTGKEFWSGSTQQVALNYMTAKHEVKRWYTKPKADSLISALNSGRSFKEAYGQ